MNLTWNGSSHLWQLKSSLLPRRQMGDRFHVCGKLAAFPEDTSGSTGKLLKHCLELFLQNAFVATTFYAACMTLDSRLFCLPQTVVHREHYGQKWRPVSTSCRHLASESGLWIFYIYRNALSPCLWQFRSTILLQNCCGQAYFVGREQVRNGGSLVAFTNRRSRLENMMMFSDCNALVKLPGYYSPTQECCHSHRKRSCAWRWSIARELRWPEP